MKKTKKKINFFLFLLSLLVGINFSFYHFLGWLKFGKLYSPLVLNQDSASFTVDETIFYASKVREIMDGNWKLGDVLIKEYREKPSPFIGEYLPAIILSGLGKISGRVDRAFILADFIFPILTFLSFSYLLNLMIKNKLWSFIGALMVMFFYHYLSYFPYFPSIIQVALKALNKGSYSLLIRSFHPQISLLFFSWFLILFYQKRFWLTGIFLGLLAYSHFFYFSFAFAFLALSLKKSLQAIILGLLISLPYLINLWLFKNSPLSSEFLLKSHFAPGVSLNQLGVIFFGLGLSYLIKNNKIKIFFRKILLTGLMLVLGADLINLGLDDPIGHWMQRVIYPISMVLYMIIIFQYFKKLPRRLGIIFIIVLLSYQFVIHRQYFENHQNAFYLEHEKLDLFEWLDQNTPKNSVIATDSLKDNLYLSVYTHNYSFIPRAQISLAPTWETEERFLIAQKMAGKTETELRGMFRSSQTLKSEKRFNFNQCAGIYLYFRQFAGKDYYNCSVADEKLSELISRYNQLQIDFNKFEADYWLTNENSTIETGNLLWENRSYKLYKL